MREQDGGAAFYSERIKGQAFGLSGITELYASVSAKTSCLMIPRRDLCSIFTFIHGKGIIRRDLKLSNMILTKDGRIRLIDFDAACMLKDEFML